MSKAEYTSESDAPYVEMDEIHVVANTTSIINNGDRQSKPNISKEFYNFYKGITFDDIKAHIISLVKSAMLCNSMYVVLVSDVLKSHYRYRRLIPGENFWSRSKKEELSEDDSLFYDSLNDVIITNEGLRERLRAVNELGLYCEFVKKDYYYYTGYSIYIRWSKRDFSAYEKQASH